jgi:hypothetical protein
MGRERIFDCSSKRNREGKAVGRLRGKTRLWRLFPKNRRAQSAAQTVDVVPRTALAGAFLHFWRRKARREGKRFRIGIGESHRGAEIDQYWIGVRAQEDVRRLQISVDKVTTMDEF